MIDFKKNGNIIFILALLLFSSLYFLSPDKEIIVRVGFMDTGVEYPHTEVIHKSFVSRENYYQNNEREYDLHLHGTTNYELFYDAIKELGIEKNIQTYSAKVMNKYGSGSGKGLTKGMNWLIDNEVDIIGMPLGAEPDVENVLPKQIDKYVYENNGVVIAASGNRGFASYTNGQGDVPAIYPNVIGVGAITELGDMTYYTSRGKSTLDSYAVEFVEIGESGNRLNPGTSFGVPRLMAKATYIQVKAIDIIGRLLSTDELGAIMAESTDAPFSKEFGWGVVDIENAVAILNNGISIRKWQYDPTIEYTRLVGENTSVGAYFRQYITDVFDREPSIMILVNTTSEVELNAMDPVGFNYRVIEESGWHYLQYYGITERTTYYYFDQTYELPTIIIGSGYKLLIDLSKVNTLGYGRYGAFTSFEEGLRLQGFEVDYILPFTDFPTIYEPLGSNYDVIYYPFQNTIWNTNTNNRNATLKIESYAEYDDIRNQIITVDNHTGNILKLDRYELDEIDTFNDETELTRTFTNNLPQILFKGVGLNFTYGIPLAWNEFGHALLYYFEDSQKLIYGSTHSQLDPYVQDTNTIFNNLMAFVKLIGST